MKSYAENKRKIKMQKVGRCLECGANRILHEDMCKRCHANSFMAVSDQVAA